ncbi:MAG: superoxide dismutase [Phycisphaerae bacterium]|jgi:Fe-Mn family superoxide dismutase
MAYELAPLPYAYDALEPHIDAKTMEIHHSKHHQAYVNNANKALEGHPDLAAKPIDEVLRHLDKIPADIRQAVINHGGGVYNHNFFWQIMGPKKGGEPKGKLAIAIGETFGNFANFKEQFTKAAATQFGSGWAWLGLDQNGRLHVGATSNQDSPISTGHTPLLALDVWEHSYYLKYQNRRPDYITAWWNVVNWDKVAELYELARK